MSSRKRDAIFELYKSKQQIAEKLQHLKLNDKSSHMSMFKIELKDRMRVMRRLGHISVDGVLQQKGKVQCLG
jgi:hypothetical protein